MSDINTLTSSAKLRRRLVSRLGHLRRQFHRSSGALNGNFGIAKLGSGVLQLGNDLSPNSTNGGLAVVAGTLDMHGFNASARR